MEATRVRFVTEPAVARTACRYCTDVTQDSIRSRAMSNMGHRVVYDFGS